MRLFATVKGQPVIITGYVSHKDRVHAIVIGLSNCPLAVRLEDCILPKIPKRLQRKINHFVKSETKDLQQNLVQ